MQSANHHIGHNDVVDIVTGYCGLCLPTLSTRIGPMALSAQSFAQNSSAASRQGSARFELALPTDNPATGPVRRRRPPAKTTPIFVAPGPAPRAGYRDADACRQAGHRDHQRTSLDRPTGRAVRSRTPLM
jgi:hypothetical protein